MFVFKVNYVTSWADARPQRYWREAFSKHLTSLLSRRIKAYERQQPGRQSDTSSFWKQAFSFLSGILSPFWHSEMFCSQQEPLYHIRQHLSSSQLEMNTRAKFTSLIPFKDMFDCKALSTLFDILLRPHDWTKLWDSLLPRHLLTQRLFFESTLPPSGLIWSSHSWRHSCGVLSWTMTENRHSCPKLRPKTSPENDVF